MKLFILKLLSLLVFCLGLVSLGIAMGLPEIQSYLIEPALEFLASSQDKLPPALDFLKGALTPQGLWFTGSVIAIVLGIYGFFPRMAKYRKPKKIAYEGPHGEVQIQLESVENSLNQVLARMPEIKKINVRVDPQENGRKALIRADVVLYQQPGQNARAVASLVSDYIAETATKLLGLEELANIDLNVTGIVVNTRKSSKAIRKESLSHSGNAPVELLEAAPTPLTLSGPNNQPLGSGPIEEELDEDAESEGAMDASAVDTRQDESNQAAARSELLEPLSMGESAPEHQAEREEALLSDSDHDTQPETPDAGQSDHGSDAVEDATAPRQMDGLDEALGDDDADDELNEASGDYSTAEADDTPEQDGMSSVVEPETADAPESDPDEAPKANDAELSDDFVPEAASVSDETSDETPDSPAYPWDGRKEGAVDSTDLEHSGFQPGYADHETLEGSDAQDREDQAHHTDAAMGEVTIPEADETEQEPSDEDKKRWGGWFN